MPKIGEYVKFKNYERKTKSPFIIYEVSYTNKCQKHIAWSYGYKLVRVDDEFSKPYVKMLLTILLVI